ncbi:outer membrane protein [Rhizobium leguminosarum]|uniref:Outer membrane protein beta-barrel domain family protein n=1 Tax=Rhizobium leguminosarum TaxID=384 RepID=A0A2Z4YS76_RHILE|nr:outer membrane protein [Rhizobium leguminosarum]AXA43262.1 Outer membrane protein beta-barrel domain family protein [Rhizobium leguminosarum]
MRYKTVSLTLAVIVAASSLAIAADPFEAAPAPEAPDTFSWSGFYVGVNAGYGFGADGNISSEGQLGPNIANIATGARPGSVDLDRNGILGGGQIGYNWQAGSFVYGLEADISFTDLDDDRNIVTPQINTGLAQGNVFRSELDYLGTVRGRLGYALDRTLFYGTAGLAYGRSTMSVDMFAPNGVRQFTGEKTGTNVGYAVGAGVEYAVTSKISLKSEYLYYDLGEEKLNVQAIPGTGVAGGYDSKFNNDGHLFRVGLNYAF